ncbi:MAG: hypothetical protein IPM42_14345 [Saprospiraceae bacterium]|nr:hypothetical protein [Saprospiraceae bacterium]
MNAHKANLINAVSLIFLPLWGYLDSLTPSMTALIPMVFGIVLLSLNNGVQYGIKSQSHAAVVITLLVLISLIKPLTGAIDREDSMAILRVSMMILTGVVSLFFFIKSFRDVRLARQKKSGI